MERHQRGSRVPITVIFHNSTGGIAQPTSANITISYADAAASTLWTQWPLDGQDRLTTTVALASVSTVAGTWATTWNSAVASTGLVFWTAYPSTTVYEIINGQFELIGNLANPIAIPSTAG